MAISLQKGQGVNLRKDTGFDLSYLRVVWVGKLSMLRLHTIWML